MDINIIRRLINTWCKFDVKKNNKNLIEYAKEKNFKAAFELFASLQAQMVLNKSNILNKIDSLLVKKFISFKELCFAVLACNQTKVEKIVKENQSSLKLNFKNMVIF